MSGSRATIARLTRRAAIASTVVAVLLIVLKVVATAKTGSVAMLGSLADSALDLLASLITLFAVKVAATPADDQHRFGHGKAEAIAALMQTGIILVSAAGIGLRAVDRFIHPQPVVAPEMGVGVSLVAIVATLLLVLYQRMVVQRTRSIAIRTDQLHYQSDLLLNSSVIAALVIEAWAGLHGADALFGIGIALYLAWGAVRAASHALDMLMDKEWPAARRRQVIDIVEAHPQVRGLHELRTRSSGADEFIQFHIWVDADMTVAAAHKVADAVEDALARAFPQADILIHVDPEGHRERRRRALDAPETEAAP
ncbi:cation diffusion facilitator family transporter [Parapedomonas caeni]